MPFAIELFFNPPSDLAVRNLGEWIEKGKIPTIFSTQGSTPHVSLAVFEQYNPDRLHALLKKVASSFSPIPFRLSSAATFPGKEGILFLAPVVTSRLLEIHSWLHRALTRVVEGSWFYYYPDAWVPHCTLSVKLPPRKLNQGLDRIRQRDFSVRGRYNRLALVEFGPHIKPVRLIYSLPFSGKKA